MNIVITGGAGFVGTNLAKRLLEEGHRVMVLDDYSVGTIENQIEGVKYIPMNIEQINYMSGEEVDVCFHLAALSRIQPSFENPSEFFRVNVSGTELSAVALKELAQDLIKAIEQFTNKPFPKDRFN